MDRHPPNETPMMPMPEKPRHKRIEAHTIPELTAAVDAAVAKFGDDFWIMLYGIDAYMERRKKRDARERERDYSDERTDPWGNS